MAKIENSADRNYYNGRNMSIIGAYSEIARKARIEKYRASDKPSYQDEQNKFEQMEEGTRLFKSGVEYTNEELREKGFYVLRQYLIEARRHEAALYSYDYGKKAYGEGKKLEDVSQIYHKNENFLKGYCEEAGRDLYRQGKDISEADSFYQEVFNVDNFTSGYFDEYASDWFKENKTLADANQELLNNKYFLEGYWRALGRDWFNQGKKLEDEEVKEYVPEVDYLKTYFEINFLKGYQEAEKKVQKDNITR